MAQLAGDPLDGPGEREIGEERRRDGGKDCKRGDENKEPPVVAVDFSREGRARYAGNELPSVEFKRGSRDIDRTGSRQVHELVRHALRSRKTAKLIDQRLLAALRRGGENDAFLAHDLRCAVARNAEAAEKVRQSPEIERYHQHAFEVAVEEKLGRGHRCRFETRGQDVGHAPHRPVAFHRRAVPRRAERHIGGFGFLAIEKEDVAGDELVEVAAQIARTAGHDIADLDHLDLPVADGLRAEESPVGKAEADP